MKNIRDVIEDADVVVILAGAGMGADSGLATYKGNNGINSDEYQKLTTQDAFNKNPKEAWGLHGQLYNDYKRTTPHTGYKALLALVEKKKEYFVVTSNVDGHFQKAGFDKNRVYEIHGRMGKMQCTECGELWDVPKNKEFKKGEVPQCDCGGTARPNIMMFNDVGFDGAETKDQSKRFNEFMHRYDKGSHKIALLEFGAGKSVPTIRNMSDFISERVDGATLVRINVADSDGPEGTISVAKGAIDAIAEDLVPTEIRKVFFMD